MNQEPETYIVGPLVLSRTQYQLLIRTITEEAEHLQARSQRPYAAMQATKLFALALAINEATRVQMP